MAVKMFKSFEDYENWTEQFKYFSDYENIPTAIDDGWKVAVDMFTECKNWKTALRRFAKVFKEVNSEIEAWAEIMRDTCEAGWFQDTTGWMPAWTSDPERAKDYAKFGTYSWGVEETTEGCWYVYLNISGIYAGREAIA